MLDSLNFTDFTKQIKADKIGQSQLRRSAKEGNIDTGLTGVLADYRGKGIAKALKVLATTYALEHNFSTITTHNHSTNRPMLSINEAMGYAKSPAIIILQKHIHTKF